MKENTSIRRSDLIQLDTKESNCIKLALLINKKFKLYPNFMFTYIKKDISHFQDLDIFQNLIIDSSYSNYQSIKNVTNAFENHFALSDLEKAIAFLGDLTRKVTALDKRERHYFMLAKLHLQKKKIVIVEDLEFGEDYEVQQDFMKAILSYKEEKTFFLAPQENILATLASKKIIQKPGIFEICSLADQVNISKAKSVSIHQEKPVSHGRKKVA